MPNKILFHSLTKVYKIVSFLLLVIIHFYGCGGYITEGTFEPDDNYKDRSYEYNVPSNYDPSLPMPLIFVFHGSQSSGISMQMATHFDEYSEAGNFIVVYPNAVSGIWNCYDACSRYYGDDANDYGFVDYLIEYFSERYPVDPARIYACGFSLGACFSINLGLDKSNKFAAIVSVAGNMSLSSESKFSSAGRIPFMVIHGMLDDKVLWDGSGTGDCEKPSIRTMMELWANHNGCNQNPTVVDLPDTGEEYIRVVKETYDNCRENTETILYKIEGGIHEWFMFEEFNATETIIDFFMRHSL